MTKSLKILIIFIINSYCEEFNQQWMTDKFKNSSQNLERISKISVDFKI